MKKLQVKLDGTWQYVFCRNHLKSTPIITARREKAQPGDDNTLDYFREHFGSLDFRKEP